MCLWKRVVIMTVVLALSVGFLVMPASASTEVSIVDIFSEIDNYTYTVIDGEFFGNDNTYGFAEHLVKGSISWNLPTAVNARDYYIVIDAKKAPVMTFSSGTYIVDCTHLGSNGNYHYYHFEYTKALGRINLTLDFSAYTEYSGVCSLISAYGTLENAYQIDNVSLTNQRLVYVNDVMEREPFESVSNVALPYTSTMKSEYVNSSVDPLLGGYIFLTTQASDIPFVYCDSLTYMIATCGSADYLSDGPNFSASLVSSSGEYITALPVYVSGSSTYLDTDRYFGSDAMQWPIYLYTVTVDTSGHDLDGLSIMLDYQVDPVYIEEVDGWCGYMSEVRAIYAMPTLEIVPWYARFGRWITTGFNNVIDALKSGFESLIDAIGGALGLDSGSSQIVDEMQSAVDEKNEQLDQASEALGGTDKPEIDAGDLIGGYIAFDTGGLQLLSCLTSNRYVTDMMVMIFTFCLIGYIFFGKKD